MKKDRIIYELWKILTNIDLANDVAKTDKSFREMTEKLIDKRFDIEEATSEYIDELYKLFS